MTQYQISVVAPCYNEAGNLNELVSRIQRVFTTKMIKGELVLINDASTDNTEQVIDHLVSEYSNVIAVHHKVNRGIAEGWKSGLAASKGDLICLIDADLQNLPEDIWRLYQEIKNSGYDIVQGYRSSVGRLRDSRFLLSKVLNFLLNKLFGMNSIDNKSGFIICRRSVLNEILRYRFNYYHFQSFIMVSAKAKGFTIREIETLFESRLIGKSFIPRVPYKLIFEVFLDIFLAVYEFRISGKQHTILAEYFKDHPTVPKLKTMPGWRRQLFILYAWTMPLHGWLISKNIKNYYDELVRSQWLSPKEIQDIQEQKLRKLVHQAYYHVSYYRDIMDRIGIKPSDIQKIEDLQKFPLLDKRTISQNLYFGFLSNNHDKRHILKITTSGSTGEPFVCYADKFQLEMRWAATLRSMEWTGYRFGDRQARLWHQTIGMDLIQVVKEFIDAFLNRRLFIPAFEISDKNIQHWIKKLEKYKPVLIDGYAESFNFLAYYVKTHNFKGFSPKGIISSAQVLPEKSRKIIEEEFKCKVFDKYGSREFSGIAYESDGHDGHLVVAENYIVEILKEGQPAKPGEIGEVVITDLNNFCMPFIRYRVGDLAVAMDNTQISPCGRGLPRIGRVEGRVQAIIFGTNGNYIPGTFFAHFFKDYDYIIRQFQIIQEELNKVTLKIIKAQRFNEQIFNKMLSQLRYFLGSEMNISVEFVDSIPMVRTGKHQVAINKISIDFQKL